MWYEYIIYLLIIFVSAFVYIKSLEKVSGSYPNISIKIKIHILTVCIFMLFNNLYSINIFRLIISYFLTLIMFLITFQKSITKLETVIFSIYLFVVSIILEIFIGIVFSKLLIDLSNVNNIFYIKSIISILHILLVFIFFKTKAASGFYNALIKISQKSFFYEILFLLIIISLNIFSIILGYDYTNSNIEFYIIISLSILLLLLAFLLLEKQKKQQLELKAKYLLELTQNNEIIIKEYKTLKHNLINDFLFIRSNLNTKYIDEKINNYSKDYEWLSSMDFIPQGIQGLIYLKSYESQKYGVKLIINNNGLVKNDIKFKSKVFSSINEALGIYLDNAIDAAKKIKDKKVYINLNKTKNHFIIEIINEINSSVNIDKLGTLNYSTKEAKSGIGLDYARKISKGKFKIFTNIINNYFKVTLKINISK